MKTCYIKQPAGLGDILFCQKIATKIKEKGYNVIWPVASVYNYINNYIDGVVFDDINKYDWFNSCGINIVQINDNGDIFVPLQDADKSVKTDSLMVSKYNFININYDDWYNYLKINRNYNRENQLMGELNIQPGDDYDVVCNTFGTPPTTVACSYMDKHIKNIIQTRKTIQMFNSSKYNVFDWIGVLENSNTIYTTDTCFIYLIEALNLGKQLFMYSRYTPPNFIHVKPLLKRQWVFVN